LPEIGADDNRWITSDPQGVAMREVCPEINWQLGIDLVGDEALFYDLLKDYREIAGGYLQAIRTAIDTGDEETVHLRSHSIKGSSANLALPLVSEKAALLEKAARDHRTSEYPMLFDDLLIIFNRTCAMITAELDPEPLRSL
jgi:HPt (histidine-containing phosphotransfer) domain-containing protein